MSQLILVRPGCTDYDEQRRIQGALNLPLSARGREQTTKLLAELSSVEFSVVYSSPTEPALEVARILAESHGVPCKCLEALVNVNQGLWQGLQLDELKRKQPKVYKQWQESPACICPPGGESLADALDRVRKALERPLRKKGRFVVVAADPLAGLIAAAATGTSLDAASPACCGRCGTWTQLCDGGDSGSFEFPAVDLAAVRAV